MADIQPGQAGFSIINNHYYMSIPDGKTALLDIGPVVGDISGIYPPSDYMIQSQFPTYGINFSLKTDELKTLLSTFRSHANGVEFFVDCTSDTPKMERAQFMVKNGRYLMNLNGSGFQDIGAVKMDFLSVLPPTTNQIKSKFPTYWWAIGAIESMDQTVQFSNHTFDESSFNLRVFSGPN